MCMYVCMYVHVCVCVFAFCVCLLKLMLAVSHILFVERDVCAFQTGLFAKPEIGGSAGAFYGNPEQLGWQV